MSSIFCCSDAQPYKDRTLSHEPKFRAFMAWAEFPKQSTVTSNDIAPDAANVTVAVQVVKQVNFGPLESKRYFVQIKDDGEFVEVTEQWLVNANFQKLNTYKNYKCGMHNKFFEVNIYQRDPVNAHHWRANIARPATEIDL